MRRQISGRLLLADGHARECRAQRQGKPQCLAPEIGGLSEVGQGDDDAYFSCSIRHCPGALSGRHRSPVTSRHPRRSVASSAFEGRRNRAGRRIVARIVRSHLFQPLPRRTAVATGA